MQYGRLWQVVFVFAFVPTEYRLGYVVSAARVVCPGETMPLSRGAFVVGPASLYLLTCDFDFHFDASLQASPRGNHRPPPHLRLGHSRRPAGVTRLLTFTHDDCVPSSRCTPLRIWLDSHVHLPHPVTGILGPSRFLGVCRDIGLLDSIHQ